MLFSLTKPFTPQSLIFQKHLTVSHRRLLKKLDYYGIRGSLRNWFESFLTQRTQSVVIEGASSAPVVTASGVPQGTVLGPLLLLMYINDLPDGLNSTVRLFVDDAMGQSVVTKTQPISKMTYIDKKLGNKSGRCNLIFQSVRSFAFYQERSTEAGIHILWRNSRTERWNLTLIWE